MQDKDNISLRPSWSHITRLTHGHCSNRQQSPEYRTWRAVIGRCLNPTNKKYHLYGGKGITICERWLTSFENFLADMGQKPSRAHSIERKNGAKGYSLENCCWATAKEQARNTTQNHWITFRGETLCITDWAIRLGLSAPSLRKRLRKWSIERAMTEPSRGR